MASRLLIAAAALIALSALSGEAAPIARLITEDSKTKGDWEMSYGADGGEVVGDKPFLPKYAQLTKAGQYFIWSADAEDDCALNKKGGEERIAACFYDKKFTLDLFLKDGEHRVAVYFNDFNR